MQTIQIPEPIRVVGLALRTTNERAFNDIPAHWQRFHREGALALVPSRSGDDVYAVYTGFEHEGVDNRGWYVFVIGVRVDDAQAVPDGMIATTIPAGPFARFPVDTAHPERVGARWRDVWACDDIDKTFVCDFERYGHHGEIDILVGIRA